MTQEEAQAIARSVNAAYHRQYRAKNPDKIREINARYREKQKRRRKEAVSDAEVTTTKHQPAISADSAGF